MDIDSYKKSEEFLKRFDKEVVSIAYLQERIAKMRNDYSNLYQDIDSIKYNLTKMLHELDDELRGGEL